MRIILLKWNGETLMKWLSEQFCMESQMGQNSPGFHRRVIIKTPFS